MSRFLFFLGCLLSITFSQPLFGQSAPTPKDTIFTLMRDTLLTKVSSISSSKVFYTHPDSSIIRSIERKKVQKIIYSSGKIEQYNKPLLVTLSNTDWRSIILTENKADIDGLYLRAVIIGKSSSTMSSAYGAKKSAETMAKKKGAYNGGMFVLVTNRKEIGGYGETPRYYIEGEVYGSEPLPSGAKMKNEVEKSKPKKLL